MENNKSEFDVTVGGTENVPNEITVGQFAQARCREILALSEVIDNPQKTNLVYQRLPKHMQRRAMSHNAKRLPRRLREIHKQQRDNLKLPSSSKRPSRKYRRRPRNLLAEYNRRKRHHTWLETHIWHAKRFHMIEKWGYVLPNRPSDKSFRACYRAATSHCALQDISSFCCFELCGPQDTLLECLKQHTSTECGLTFSARAFLTGDREGAVFFFRKGSYPKGAIGKVSFIWKPVEESQIYRVIWIWCHPAFYQAILNELQSTFSLQSSSLADIFCNEESNINLNLLKDKLNRFRLTGPLSQSVLTQALLPVTPTAVWDIMKTVASPSQIPPHVVIGVDVQDPRLCLPRKRTKALPHASASLQQIHKLPNGSHQCNIWNKETRDKVTSSKLSTSEVSSIHSRHIVPSVEGNNKSPGEPIPLMIIHRPGGTSGVNCGWDVVIPSGYAMPIWISLIFRGARACGLRDMKAIELIDGEDTFPPDTEAGFNEAICLEKELTEKYFRKPPNKRPNFMKLGIASPFTCSWDTLVKEWTSKEMSAASWYVIRSKQMHDSCLVPVTVTMFDRGRPAPFAIVCIPYASDIKTKVCPTEPPHTDTRQTERKDLVTAHRVLLRQLKRNRKKGQNVTENQSSKHVMKHKETLQSLWLPEATHVKDSCIRPIMGFLSKGDFCFTQACGVGQGYVVLAGLKELHKQHVAPWVLVRNPTSRQYRLGKLQFPSYISLQT